ncbi:MAG: formylmethanofuran dehydrogenase [Acidobacteria bacterium]|nr:formylmethanofuran dehydrogenase [Acidobacteriota bacterium]
MTLDTLLHEAEVAHGHLCAGQVLGVRMAMLALDRLGISDPRSRYLSDESLNPDRKRLVTFVEIDRCATDAIAVVTGCRVGKRALKLRDFGKMAATFVDLNQRLAGTDDDKALSHDYKALRIVALETSKALARSLYPELDKNAQQMRAYRELPDADLFTATWVRVPLPPNEFPGYKGTRATCDACGEGINFDRFIDRDGVRLCLACATPSLRYYHPF